MKKFILILICILLIPQFAMAEKYPVKITPIQEISTHEDSIEVGDWIKFKIVDDVYIKENLYISKNSVIIGIVDYVHENGFLADNAEIFINTFKVRIANGNLIEIKYPLRLNRTNMVVYDFKQKLQRNAGVIFRGNEIYIKPYTTTYNLILNK